MLPKQRFLYLILIIWILYYETIASEDTFQVFGPGGVGKSEAIKKILVVFKNLVLSYTPSGKTAENLYSKTFFDALNIFPFKDPTPSDALKISEDYKNIRLVIQDEYFFTGLNNH